MDRADPLDWAVANPLPGQLEVEEVIAMSEEQDGPVETPRPTVKSAVAAAVASKLSRRPAGPKKGNP